VWAGFRLVTLGSGSTGLQRGRSCSGRTHSFRPLIPRPVAWRLNPCGRISGMRGFPTSDPRIWFDWAATRTLGFRPDAWFPISSFRFFLRLSCLLFYSKTKNIYVMEVLPRHDVKSGRRKMCMCNSLL
jgi:hypothetical protein